MTEENPMIPPVIDLDRLHLVGQEYKIAKTQCDFDLYKLTIGLKKIL